MMLSTYNVGCFFFFFGCMWGKNGLIRSDLALINFLTAVAKYDETNLSGYVGYLAHSSRGRSP